MKCEGLDPRIVTYEDESPRYWVIFWSYGGRDENGRYYGLESDEWRLSGARDIYEVIEWANSDKKKRQYQIFSEYTVPETDALGISLLYGEDPSKDSAFSEWVISLS